MDGPLGTDLREQLLAGPMGNFSSMRLPQLRCLVLNFSSHTWPAFLDLTFAPGLRCFSIRGFAVIPIKLPSPNYLTKVSGRFTIDEITSILQHCHQLRELEWRASLASDLTSRLEGLSRVIHPLLDHLSFFVESPDEDRVLRSVSAPRLRSLSLMSSLAPARNQFPDLERLYLYQMSDIPIITVLRKVPDIKELAFRSCDESPILLQALIERNDRGVLELVPSLRELSLDSVHLDWAEALASGRNIGTLVEESSSQFIVHTGFLGSTGKDAVAVRPRRLWPFREKLEGEPFDDSTWASM